jgi:hypothetical protein
MKERPILFSGEMVRAILDDRKTMTRRVIKPQPEGDQFSGFNAFGEAIFYPRNDNSNDPGLRKCPYQKGQTLWVRETWAAQHAFDPHSPKEIYSAAIEMGQEIIPHYAATENLGGLIKRPSIFMPRWASRITLEITDVRVERVRDISEEDAISEGVDAVSQADIPRQATWNRRQDFKQLWDSINAKRGYGWDANPWVWVVEFKRVTS